MKYKYLLIILCLFTQLSFAQVYQGWRGENRDGIYNEPGLLKSWPEEGPELLWVISDAGKGHSSPVVSGNKIFVTGLNEDGDKEQFSVYNLNGERLYQVEFGTAWDKTYPDSRTTPSVLGNKAYLISGMGEIVCINTDNGNIVWSVNGEQFGRLTGKWGTSESPLIVDGKIIYSPGGTQTAVVALNAADGKTVWQSKSLSDTCSYASPLLIHHKGKKQIIGFTTYSMYGLNPENGEIQWQFSNWDFDTQGSMDGICINTPLFRDGKLFVCNAYNMQSFMFELNDDLTGIKLLWRNQDMGVHLGGMVVLDSIIYGNNKVKGEPDTWVALSWNTGETKYKIRWEEGKTKGVIIAADGMLYCYEEKRGTVALVKPNPDTFEVVSEFRVKHGEGPHWSHPTIHNGILYIRHGNVVMAYQVK
jgi:outer membrane protein assembly factor BamB